MKSVGLVIKEMQRPWSLFMFMGWGFSRCIIPKAVAAAGWGCACRAWGQDLCGGCCCKEEHPAGTGGGRISPAKREGGDGGQQSAEEWALPIQPC